MFSSAFLNKRVLVTGHTGFKGAWLTAWLNHLGAQVTGVSLDPPTNPSLFSVADLTSIAIDHRLDISCLSELVSIFIRTQPDYVFHLAAQPLVRDSYLDPVQTWKTNLTGTINVLEALRALHSPCSAVFITSDKCYDNVEWTWGYRENDTLGGADPYSASKAAAELAIKSYVKSFFSPDISPIRIASARAGNVIGGGDWASYRIIPDCVRAWSLGEYVDLRCPHSTRPWQHVLEPLSGYLSLALALKMNSSIHGEPFNFGPLAHVSNSVLDLVEEMASYWPQVLWRDVSQHTSGPYESGLLKLNCDKALHQLQWRSTLSFTDTVRFTAEWYRSYYDKVASPYELTLSQIKEYTSLAHQQGLSWACPK